METDLPLSFLPYASIPVSLIMRESGRCLCQRGKPHALSWDFFFYPCTQTSSSLTYALELFSVVFGCL